MPGIVGLCRCRIIIVVNAVRERERGGERGRERKEGQMGEGKRGVRERYKEIERERKRRSERG